MSVNLKNSDISLQGQTMRRGGANFSRRTTTDDIFDQLYADITSLELKPGTKVSEIEIAKRFDVSRQPVREAFIRLSNMGLLQVRPQRATIVRKISLQEVSDSRFIRTAIEVEVAGAACAHFGDEHKNEFEENLAKQKLCVDQNDFMSFKVLDADFHRQLCYTARCEMAYRSISLGKAQVDRLCTLSLTRGTEFVQIYQDHVNMYELLKKGDADGLVALTRMHLSRLDSTIAEASASDEDFFED